MRRAGGKPGQNKEAKMNEKQTQVLAEELAFHDLKKKGYKILLRNYECPIGEVDMIAKKDGKLIFLGVNRSKLKMDKIKKTAAYYLKRYGIMDREIAFENVIVRLDGADTQISLEVTK